MVLQTKRNNNKDKVRIKQVYKIKQKLFDKTIIVSAYVQVNEKFYK